MIAAHCDVLVVGAGPAGLFAALGVAASGRRVIVIDAGPDIEDRTRARASEPSAYLVSGIGGAGLFSDGKLCLSLGVGGELGAITSPHVRARLLRSVAEVFEATHLLETEADLQCRSQAAPPSQVAFSYYPVSHLGTDHCADRIRDVRDRLVAAGGEIASQTRLLTLDRAPAGPFSGTVRRKGGAIQTIVAPQVVLALGKVGSKFQERLSRRLGASSSWVPMYVGARLEGDREDALPLFSEAFDPKLKLYFDDGSKIKTHCASDGGEVLPLFYEGLPVAGGHASSLRSSGRTSFGLLWNGIDRTRDNYATALSIMRRTAEMTSGRLLAQRIHDVLSGRASHCEKVAAARPTTSLWSAGDLRAVLPAKYFDRLKSFFQLLCERAPGLDSDRTILFGPAIEWWMSRVVTDQQLQTAVSGLYVAGDGAGWSQGIIHAAATGVLVSEAITGQKYLSSCRLSAGRSPLRRANFS